MSNNPFPPELSDLAARIVAHTLSRAVETAFCMPGKEKSYSRVMRHLDKHRRILRGLRP